MNATRILASGLIAAQLALPVAAAPTDISQLPITATNQATPNVIFGVDDSGSMDSEVLLKTNDGALWWDGNQRRFWDGTGTLNFNTVGAAGNSGGTTWYKYVYLFPNGTGTGNRIYADATFDHFAVAPTGAYAFLRSADYNPLYYNSTVTYNPWPPAYVSGATRTYPAATASGARSHPALPVTTGATTVDLTQSVNTQSAGWTFRMYAGMVIPGALISGITGSRNGGAFNPVTTNITIAAGDTWNVAIPYYPATYYVKDATCTGGWPNCATAPDGANLRRYEIKAGNTFPSGRTYADEMQNFANWFTYYRKRRLMLAGGVGDTLSQVKGLRAGSVNFNALGTVSMYDFSSTADSSNGRALLGAIYTNPANSGTPTRAALNHIGQQYMSDTNIVQYGCQRNSAFILTDGFANNAGPTPPAYTPGTYVGSPPYTTVHANSLADIAAAYYTLNLRPDLPAGLLSVDPSDTSPNADRNTNLHMNTYAVTVGAVGTIYGNGTPAATNPFINYPTWPAPTQNRHPSSVDDLWHATINGRGEMFLANNATQLTQHLRQVILNMLTKAGSDSGVAVSNVNLKNGDNTAYVSSYNAQNWTGQLAAYPVDVVTGQVNIAPSTQLWEARDTLTARTPASRLIVTYDGTQGIPFQTGSVIPAGMKALLNTPSQSDADNVIAYLRGERSLEGSTYRTRAALLGDVISAEPVFVGGPIANYADPGYNTFATTIGSRQKMIYQAANDGMLHAFNATSGAEVWAYVPAIAFPKLNALTNPLYTHQFSVDGTPTVGDVDLANTVSGGYGSGTWRTILVGGMNAGGVGYYALDVSVSDAADEAAAASKVLWEFPNASTPATVRQNLGLSFGKPIIAKTRHGWVVLVTSGYNNNAGGGTGQGYLFVLDARTGQVLAYLSTGEGDTGTPSGLAQISAWANNPALDATIDYVYGGDLLGNVWRFDLTSNSIASWNVSKLAALVNGSGQAQPVTSPPELAQVDGRRIVYVGTGALLGNTDVTNTQGQSMYALVDNLTAAPLIPSVRTSLTNKAVTVGAGGLRSIDPTPVNYSTSRGWYFDLPGTGERVNTAPTAAFGVLVFTSNQPSATACSSQSFLYAVSLSTGGQLPPQSFAPGENAWSGKALGNTLASRPVVVVLPNGQVQSITHRSDTTLTSSRLPVALGGKVRRVGWKEIFR